MREQLRAMPPVRFDTKGKWRQQVPYTRSGPILTSMSWDRKSDAEDWVRWNNFDEGLYGEIIRNPEL